MPSWPEADLFILEIKTELNSAKSNGRSKYWLWQQSSNQLGSVSHHGGQISFKAEAISFEFCRLEFVLSNFVFNHLFLKILHLFQT